jgi:hypothetical protein
MANYDDNERHRTHAELDAFLRRISSLGSRAGFIRSQILTYRRTDLFGVGIRSGPDATLVFSSQS